MNKKIFYFLILFLVVLSLNSVKSEEEVNGCIPYWNCTEYSTCVEGFQVRGCIDEQQCVGTTAQTKNRPCISTGPPPLDCTPEWQCTSFSECSNEGMEKRECIDLKRCGINERKPLEENSCAPDEIKTVSIILLIGFLILILCILLTIAYLKRLQKQIQEQERTFFIPDAPNQKS